jgi:hypothetical protein
MALAYQTLALTEGTAPEAKLEWVTFDRRVIKGRFPFSSTDAFSTTSNGRDVRVSLRLAPPPMASYVQLSTDDFVDGAPKVRSADGDLLLIDMVVAVPDPDEYPAHNFLVYKASPLSRRGSTPSLRWGTTGTATTNPPASFTAAATAMTSSRPIWRDWWVGTGRRLRGSGATPPSPRSGSSSISTAPETRRMVSTPYAGTQIPCSAREPTCAGLITIRESFTVMFQLMTTLTFGSCAFLESNPVLTCLMGVDFRRGCGQLL